MEGQKDHQTLFHRTLLATEGILIFTMLYLLKQIKKTAANIIILHLRTKNPNDMIYSSWDIKRDRLKLVIFWPFTPLKTQKIRNLNFVGDIIILHMCTKNHNHMMYGLWYTEWGQTEYFVILGHFLPFYPTNNPEN